MTLTLNEELIRLKDFAFVVLSQPDLVFLGENLIRSMLCPLGRTVLKIKRVSFVFHKVSRLPNTRFTLIPINIKTPRFHIFMLSVHSLQTPKTTILNLSTLFSGCNGFAFVYLTSSDTRIWTKM